MNVGVGVAAFSLFSSENEKCVVFYGLRGEIINQLSILANLLLQVVLRVPRKK